MLVNGYWYSDTVSCRLNDAKRFWAWLVFGWGTIIFSINGESPLDETLNWSPWRLSWGISILSLWDQYSAIFNFQFTPTNLNNALYTWCTKSYLNIDMQHVWPSIGNMYNSMILFSCFIRSLDVKKKEKTRKPSGDSKLRPRSSAVGSSKIKDILQGPPVQGTALGWVVTSVV